MNKYYCCTIVKILDKNGKNLNKYAIIVYADSKKQAKQKLKEKYSFSHWLVYTEKRKMERSNKNRKIYPIEIK